MKLPNAYLSFLLLSGCFFHAQNYSSPATAKLSDIVINADDQTIKTQMLNRTPDITILNDRSYQWYSSRKIMETKGGFDGRLLHGSYSAFYLNSQLREQGKIKYGLRVKEWRYWYPDGKLREIITWKGGRKNGPYFLYNDFGQLMARGNFKNDKLHGRFITYSGSGSILEKKRYRNGDEVPEKIWLQPPNVAPPDKKERKAQPSARARNGAFKGLFKKKKKPPMEQKSIIST